MPLAADPDVDSGLYRMILFDYNPFRYRGYYYDIETGLYYLNSRYYDPEIGRFISPDDISYLGANGDLISYNLYAYCSNNPVNYQDPTGLSWKSFWESIGDWFSGTFGFSVNCEEEQPTRFRYYWFFQIEEGVGYSKSFDNGKPVNFYYSWPQKWWQFWEGSAGIDVNINGYGFGLNIGLEKSLTIHLGDFSLDLHNNAFGRIGLKWVVEGENGEYVYTNFEINGPEIVATVVAIYYAWPYLIELIKGGVVPIPNG